MTWHGTGEERMRRFRLYADLEDRYNAALSQLTDLQAEVARKDATIRTLAKELAALDERLEIAVAPESVETGSPSAHPGDPGSLTSEASLPTLQQALAESVRRASSGALRKASGTILSEQRQSPPPGQSLADAFTALGKAAGQR